MAAGSTDFVADGTAVIEAGVAVRAGVTAIGAGAVRVADGTTVMEAGVAVGRVVTDAGASVGAAGVAMAVATAAVGKPAAGAPAADFCGSHSG